MITIVMLFVLGLLTQLPGDVNGLIAAAGVNQNSEVYQRLIIVLLTLITTLLGVIVTSFNRRMTRLERRVGRTARAMFLIGSTLSPEQANKLQEALAELIDIDDNGGK